MPLFILAGLVIFLFIGVRLLEDIIDLPRRLANKITGKGEYAPYTPPTPTWPKNPYNKDGPLADAWNRGFSDKMFGRRQQGSSSAYTSGYDAAYLYITSGAAKIDQERQLSKVSSF